MFGVLVVQQVTQDMVLTLLLTTLLMVQEITLQEVAVAGVLQVVMVLDQATHTT